MKGNPQIIAALIQRAIEEQTAIQQYWVQESVFTVAGYPKLAAMVKEHREDEQGHYESILYRLRELEAMPAGGLNPVDVGGADVRDMFGVSLLAEEDAMAKYTETIALCESEGDFVTRDLLTGILKDERDHARDLEAELAKIPAMTIQNYLSAQV
ncbi:bacterioferritin [Geomonas nitrogeniifigens]|uniref:ferritin-like domain-containing protein n=1 Tax=Geomonas diazotrophica TaxID=2843197 RepID=UPI001C2C70A1|nr:ferritin-like domain-containing protein [Geomonas nitrogeniifigens]QXE85980.1 bacterioferritin [Geomonas nitrogeniifigens]